MQELNNIDGGDQPERGGRRCDIPESSGRREEKLLLAFVWMTRHLRPAHIGALSSLELRRALLCSVKVWVSRNSQQNAGSLRLGL